MGEGAQVDIVTIADHGIQRQQHSVTPTTDNRVARSLIQDSPVEKQGLASLGRARNILTADKQVGRQRRDTCHLGRGGDVVVVIQFKHVVRKVGRHDDVIIALEPVRNREVTGSRVGIADVQRTIVTQVAQQQVGPDAQGRIARQIDRIQPVSIWCRRGSKVGHGEGNRQRRPGANLGWSLDKLDLQIGGRRQIDRRGNRIDALVVGFKNVLEDFVARVRLDNKEEISGNADRQSNLRAKRVALSGINRARARTRPR